MSIFDAPKPTPQPLPTAPAADPAQIAQQQQAAAQEQLAASGGGRASTFLTQGGQLGDDSTSSVIKTLLGG